MQSLIITLVLSVVRHILCPQRDVIFEKLENERRILVVLVLIGLFHLIDCIVEGRLCHLTRLLGLFSDLVIENREIQSES